MSDKPKKRRRATAPMVAPEPVAVEEHRSPDQEAAVEAAFVAGTLPEEDRRVPEVVIVADVEQVIVDPEPAVTAEPAMEIGVFRSLEDRVEVGGKIERTARGWQVSLMYGGARKLFGEGATIEAALASAGV